MGDNNRRRMKPLNSGQKTVKKKKRPLNEERGLATLPLVILTPIEEEELKVLLESRLIDMLKPLIKSRRWLIAFYHCNGTDVKIRFKTNDFPTGDFDLAVDLLDKQLREEKARIRGTAEEEAVLTHHPGIKKSKKTKAKK